MNTYRKSPKDTTKGMMFFPRMLDKIWLHEKGELAEEYNKNLGKPRTGDGACTNFLRVNCGVLRQRRLNGGDLVVWNGFISKLRWNDFATPLLEESKQKCGAAARADINTITDLIDFDEKRRD